MKKDKDPDSDLHIMAIDVGGSHIKATVLDIHGRMLMDYEKVETPASANPEHVMKAIVDLTQNFRVCEKVSVGFPGYIRKGVVITAPNLGTKQWRGVNLANRLSLLLTKPVRVLNDADMQGLGIATGVGFEMIVTLGTGFGSALVLNGSLLPHLELAHHPVANDSSYDQYIGEKAFEEVGLEKWNQRLKKVIGILKTVFNYDHLYLGGGNSKNVNFKPEKDISLVSNKDGIRGGAKLWNNGFNFPE